MLVNRRREAGDTLVEVVMALAILSLVLTSSLAAAVKSTQLGKTANERSALTAEAQQQMEAVRAFRDNRQWWQFLYGDISAEQTYDGALSALTSGSCAVSGTKCMYMKLLSTGTGNKEYLPVAGSTVGTVPNSYVEIAVDEPPGSLPPPQYVDVTISYGFKTLGASEDSAGHIKTRLTNLQYPLGSGAVVPAGSGAFFGTPPSSGSGGHFIAWSRTAINQSPLLLAQVAGCTWDWGDGTIQTNVDCIPGKSIKHPYPVTAPGVVTDYTVILTEVATSGASATYSRTFKVPGNFTCTPGAGNPSCIPDP